MAVAYRPAESPEGFAVFRPKIVAFEGFEPSYEELSEAFFRGVHSHEEGTAVWVRALDESR